MSVCVNVFTQYETCKFSVSSQRRRC